MKAMKNVPAHPAGLNSPERAAMLGAAPDFGTRSVTFAYHPDNDAPVWLRVNDEETNRDIFVRLADIRAVMPPKPFYRNPRSEVDYTRVEVNGRQYLARFDGDNGDRMQIEGAIDGLLTAVARASR